VDPAVPSMSHKVCLFGDGSSGKTAIFRPFVRETFEDAYISTVGSKVSKRQVTRVWQTPRGPVYATSVWILWDIAPQRTFEKVIAAYTRAATGAIVVASATAADAGASARRWAKIARDAVGGGPVLLFFLDSAKARPGAQQALAVEAAADEIGADFVGASADTPVATEAALIMFGEKLVQRFLESHPNWPQESREPRAPRSPSPGPRRRGQKRP
jgi:hypothetical protein